MRRMAGNGRADSKESRKVKIVFCWSDISSYMTACWRELAGKPDVDLSIVSSGRASFDNSIMDGLHHIILDGNDAEDYTPLRELVISLSPDVLVIAGWNCKAYVRLAFERRLASAKFVLAMENPLRHDFRQFFGKIKLFRLIRRTDLAFVPGERAWRLARYWGVAANKILRGLYCFDYDSFAGLLDLRLENEWPKSFLCTGQYIKRKGIDLLVDAYMRYRTEVKDPWPLRCCGSGPLSALLDGKPGIEDLGFVQPARLPSIMADSGVFVLPSRYDAWGVAIGEACAAGLPVICTESCGSSVEIVRTFYNGITIPTCDVKALTGGLVWMHNNYDRLPEMGKRARQMAAPYSAQIWADSLLETIRRQA